MNDKPAPPAGGILDKYIRREHGEHSPGPHGGDAAHADTGSDVTDDLGCFGYLRGVRDRAIMLELRKADGSILAVGYSWLERAEFDPTDGITLHLTGRTVRIKGRNLNAEIRPQVRLFHSIVRHRVPWLRQARDAKANGTDDKSAVIESIEW